MENTWFLCKTKTLGITGAMMINMNSRCLTFPSPQFVIQEDSHLSNY